MKQTESGIVVSKCPFFSTTVSSNDFFCHTACMSRVSLSILRLPFRFGPSFPQETNTIPADITASAAFIDVSFMVLYGQSGVLPVFFQSDSPCYPFQNKKGGAVSRFLFLNLPFIFATYPLTSDGQPLIVSIFGLAAPGTVPGACRHTPS